MKNFIKTIVAMTLALLARAVVRRYHPKIVMVTGSVGKTSTKDAVAAVLAARFFVRSSDKSFNTGFGVPFTILGVQNPWNSPFAWLSILRSAGALLLLPNHYPNMLVLEVGADRPGDLARILRIATPDVVVVTRLPEIPVHVEAYESPEAVREEEFSPAHSLAAAAPLIIPADDVYALDSAVGTPARIISYGFAASALVRIQNAGFCINEGRVIGMEGRVTVDGEAAMIRVKGSVGTKQLLPAAAALATARAFDIPLEEALTALDRYVPPPGRGRLLAGRNDSVIIDDSYNASPVAVDEALETLKNFPHAARRIAVLGDMLELGRYSVIEHERVSVLASGAADIVAAVGVRSRVFVSQPGSSKVILFENAPAAALALADLVRAGDVVLVKGSQSMRTERIVEALLANPADAKLLVRQEKKWRDRP